nr:AraC family transcriptional regulator [Lachnospiraceae bacterium]
ETLTEMLTEIISDVISLSNKTSDIDVSLVRTLINDNYASYSVIDDICGKIGTTKEAIDEAFVGSYGIGLDDYLRFRRLNVAKEMLRFTIENEKDIAKECGFDDYNAFNKLFEDTESMTPETYRSKWAQWVK